MLGRGIGRVIAGARGTERGVRSEGYGSRGRRPKRSDPAEPGNASFSDGAPKGDVLAGTCGESLGHGGPKGGVAAELAVKAWVTAPRRAASRRNVR